MKKPPLWFPPELRKPTPEEIRTRKEYLREIWKSTAWLAPDGVTVVICMQGLYHPENTEDQRRELEREMAGLILDSASMPDCPWGRGNVPPVKLVRRR